MLRSVRVPVLLTHHFRQIDEATGGLMGAMSDEQAARAQELLRESTSVDYRSFPRMGHNMHKQDPDLFVGLIAEFASALDEG